MSNEENDLSPIMAALSLKQRTFVRALFTLPPGHGALTDAARLAGYGREDGGSTPLVMANIAQRLIHSDKIIAAITEIAKRQFRSNAPAALAAVGQILSDRGHKDRLRAAAMVLKRIDPIETKHNLAVTHEVINRDQDAVSHLRMLLSLDVTRAKLEEVFGFTGLSRYEDLLRIEDASKAKVIEGECQEVVSEDNELFMALPTDEKKS